MSLCARFGEMMTIIARARASRFSALLAMRQLRACAFWGGSLVVRQLPAWEPSARGDCSAKSEMRQSRASEVAKSAHARARARLARGESKLHASYLKRWAA